ncbi:hypothetical protein AB0D13_10300 [Streptomyces sp. NPDC048430]|uniref:hypothetical protein n=1 Tax=Streptomyces sp. NPDC048430 TaxID=3155388 RepID=UPI00341A7E97
MRGSEAVAVPVDRAGRRDRDRTDSAVACGGRAIATCSVARRTAGRRQRMFADRQCRQRLGASAVNEVLRLLAARPPVHAVTADALVRLR